MILSIEIIHFGVRNFDTFSIKVVTFHRSKKYWSDQWPWQGPDKVILFNPCVLYWQGLISQRLRTCVSSLWFQRFSELFPQFGGNDSQVDSYFVSSGYLKHQLDLFLLGCPKIWTPPQAKNKHVLQKELHSQGRDWSKPSFRQWKQVIHGLSSIFLWAWKSTPWSVIWIG